MYPLYCNFKISGSDQLYDLTVQGDHILSVLSHKENSFNESGSINLNGKYLLPGFIDSHQHVLPLGLYLKRLNLKGLDTLEAIYEALLEADQNLPEEKWLIASGFSMDISPKSPPLTRRELDLTDIKRPILITHQSGHAGIINSIGLKLLKLSNNIKDPLGGMFGRGPHGALNGLLHEKAFFKILNALPKPTLEEMVEAILDSARYSQRLGITCCTDMLCGFYDLESELIAYKMASEKLKEIRFRIYLDWESVFGKKSIEKSRLNELMQDLDPNRCRIVGTKLFADGTIGAGTAATYNHYLSGGQGKLIHSKEELKKRVQRAHDHGWRIAIHSIGDRATDAVLESYQTLKEDTHRHRIEHAMLLSDQQIEKIAKLSIIVSMQPTFLKTMQETYSNQLPQEQYSKIMRFKSILKSGVRLCINSDAPFGLLDPWESIRCALNRPEGYDQNENLSTQEALTAYTEAAAAANGEEEISGKIAPGYFADFQICKEDPLCKKA